MADFGARFGTFQPEKSGGGLFGNKILRVDVHKQGLRMERKRGMEEYPFSSIRKITAKNYASPTPTHIFISIETGGAPKPVDFALHPNKRDVNLLLGVYSDYQLGTEFPRNLGELRVELGGLGAPLWLDSGAFRIGDKRLPMQALEDFTTNQNGFYSLKFAGMKQKLAVSPDYAPNILTSIKILSLIVERNRNAG